MTSVPTVDPEAAPSAPAPRRAHRPTHGRMVGGVAAGLAEHVRVDVFWVRVVLVVTSWFAGLGVIVYAALWRFLPQSVPVDAHTAHGVPQRSRVETGQTVALLALGFGVLLVQQDLGLGLGDRVLWPVTIAVVGVALVWRQADEAQRQRWASDSPEVPVVGLILGSGGRSGLLRLVAGVLLIGTAVSLLVAQAGGLSTLLSALVAAALGVLGIALVLGPWIGRLVQDLATERRERIRSQERADVAAHLHDSVLQTLALLQRNADDPKAVVRLARRQERELRDWLYDDERTAERTLRTAVLEVAAEVEELHDVSVEVVCVGDVPLVDGTRALVAATGEAIVNAAKHSGTDQVAVYVEVTGSAVELFVRDRGVGFDPESVPADRWGVRHSIMERMRRHGGTAVVRSAPGDGTEVRLAVTR
ncbi:MAG: PspC domain-containing protein [Nocardioidaceae bacterium]|nr:PspC domain-containing protein [Nocardioidaceae bacterium]